MKRLVERFIALVDRRGRVHVQWRSMLVGQLRQRKTLAVEDAFTTLAVAKNKSGRAFCRAVTTDRHFFFACVPRTRIATTV